MGRLGRLGHWLSAPFRAGSRPTSPAEGEPAKPRMQNLADWFGWLRSTTISLLSFGSLLLVVVFLGIEFWRDAVVIEGIEIPGDIADLGYTPEIVAHRLRDEIGRIHRQSQTMREERSFLTEGGEMEAGLGALPGLDADQIEVPGTGISVSALVTQVRALTSRLDVAIGGKITRIGGEIVGKGGTYRLNLRISSGEQIPDIDPLEKGGVDTDLLPGGTETSSVEPTVMVEALIGSGARRLLAATDPYVLAVNVHRTDPLLATRLLRSALSNDDEEDDPWAYNLWALLLHQKSIDSGTEIAGVTQRIATIRQSVELKRSERIVAAAAFEERRANPRTRAALPSGAPQESLGQLKLKMARLRSEIASQSGQVARLEQDAVHRLRGTIDQIDNAVEHYLRAGRLDEDFAVPQANIAQALADAVPLRRLLTGLELEVVRVRQDEMRKQLEQLKTKRLEVEKDALHPNTRRQLMADLNAAIEQREVVVAEWQADIEIKEAALADPEPYAEAVRRFARAADLDPKLASTFSRWGIALQRSGNGSEALEKFERARALEPWRPEHSVRVGRLYLAARDFDAAIDAFEEAITLDESFAIAWRDLGDAREKQGLACLAADAWRRFVELEPESDVADSVKLKLRDVPKSNPECQQAPGNRIDAASSPDDGDQPSNTSGDQDV